MKLPSSYQLLVSFLDIMEQDTVFEVLLFYKFRDDIINYLYSFDD